MGLGGDRSHFGVGLYILSYYVRFFFKKQRLLLLKNKIKTPTKVWKPPMWFKSSSLYKRNPRSQLHA